MIVLGILATWLTLTAVGFAGLSALGRAGAREALEADLTLVERWPISDRSLLAADARLPIAKALLR